MAETYTTGAAMPRHFEVWAGPRKISFRGVTCYGEIYLDGNGEELRGALFPGQTTVIDVDAGEHTVNVYSGGKFINIYVNVPAEGAPVLWKIIDDPGTKPTSEKSAEEPVAVISYDGKTKALTVTPTDPELKYVIVSIDGVRDYDHPILAGGSYSTVLEPGTYMIRLIRDEKIIFEKTVTLEAPVEPEPEQPEPEEPAGEPEDGEKVTITLPQKTVLDMVTGLKALTEALTSWLEE